MSSFIFYLTLLIAVCNSQKLIYLRDLKNDAINQLHFGTTAMFLSASSDDPELLKKIIFTTGTETKMDGFDLSNQRDHHILNNRMKPWYVSGVTTATTNLTSDEISKLTGFIYITTEQQAKDKSFVVLDINQEQEEDVKLNATIVFLNSGTSQNPLHATKFSNWNQTSQTSVFLFKGLPGDNPEEKDTQIFSNPVMTRSSVIKSNHTYRFVKNVETFSTKLEASYMRVVMSQDSYFSFTISPENVDIDNTRITTANTTGFLMKSPEDVERRTVLNTEEVSSPTSTFGVNLSANLPRGSLIQVDTRYEKAIYALSFTRISSNKTRNSEFEKLGPTVTFGSRNTSGLQYTIQYYIIQNDETDIKTASSMEPMQNQI